MESDVDEGPKKVWHFLSSIEFFNSVYSRDSPLIVNSLTTFNPVDHVDMQSVNIATKDINLILTKLDVEKGVGPRKITIHSLQSLVVFPSYWKKGIIALFYKSENRNDIRNYKPIVILSTI